MGKKYQLHLKGYVGGWDFDSDYVDYVLGKNEGGEVNVIIDSLGGSVATALSISSAFARHGNVNVHFCGMNASAATIASMGAKLISMDTSAMYLVHKCSQTVLQFCSMNADQMDEFIKQCQQTKTDLEKIDLNIASMYAGRCKKDKKALLDLMSIGGWLTAEEALSWGFVDEITNEKEDAAPVIDKAAIAAMVSEGIPIPKMHGKENLFTKFFEALGSLFENQSPTKITKIMSKTFKCVCAVLNLEALASLDGKVELTDEQLTIVDEHIAYLENKISNLENEIADKDVQISNLQKAPADETTTVINERPNDFANDYVQALNNAKEMFNLIP